MVGIIYYEDNRISGPIIDHSRASIVASGLPITSCSLNTPIDFGDNYVLENRKRSYPTMVDQIIIALENSKEDYVFFCEHDVLYHQSHFEFVPQEDDMYYYNLHHWRWRYPTDKAVSWQRVVSLSQMVCNRKMALVHFRERMRVAREQGLDLERSREPRWARRWGYEPGTKPKRRGGFSDEKMGTWESPVANIDIRHDKTLSLPKTTLKEFKHPPKGWQEINIDDIEGWNLRKLFNL